MTQNTQPLNEYSLPQDPVEAVKQIIDLGLSLEGVLIQEHQALNKRDPVEFQKDKKKKKIHLDRYEMAAREFRYSLEKFKSVDGKHLDQLKALQDKIAFQSKANMDVMKTLLDQAQAEEMGIKPGDIED